MLVKLTVNLLSVCFVEHENA